MTTSGTGIAGCEMTMVPGLSNRARARVDEYRKNGALKAATRDALASSTVDALERDLQRIVGALDGIDVEESAADQEAAEVAE